MIKYGEHLEYLEELAADNPDNPPAPLLERPEVDTVTQEWLDSFNQLSAGRPWTINGPGPLPTADILAYWQIHPISNALEFLAMIRELDVLWLKQTHTKKKK